MAIPGITTTASSNDRKEGGREDLFTPWRNIGGAPTISGYSGGRGPAV